MLLITIDISGICQGNIEKYNSIFGICLPCGPSMTDYPGTSGNPPRWFLDLFFFFQNNLLVKNPGPGTAGFRKFSMGSRIIR
jgi:hypothetical protein